LTCSSFDERRIEIATKDSNNNNGSANDTNQTKEGNSITCEIVSSRHLFLDYFVMIAELREKIK